MANSRICSIPDCGKPIHGYGWCGTHYERWRVHGDPLVGREPTKSVVYFHEVVLTYDGDECLPWPFGRNVKGYARLNGKIVSRLVCEDEHGPAPTPKHEAAHSCGKGHEGCVSRRHLSWKTPKENCADTLIHGTRPRGERMGASKLTEADVHQIRALKGKSSLRELSKRFGVSGPTISSIHTGKAWYWL